MPLIAVRNLQKRFNLEAGFFAGSRAHVYAVRDLSFDIHHHETYGLVGESGCGKTTTARLLVRLYQADSGSIVYEGSDTHSRDALIDEQPNEPSINQSIQPMQPMQRARQLTVHELRGLALKHYRERVKYVFQDPARSLNPRMTIEQVLLSGYQHSSLWPGYDTARKEAAAALEEVGLQAADLERRPPEFSGGQRQRISIARGLLLKPELLICDEVVSALDVSIQGQILNLLLDIRARRNLSFLFIAHDLKVACYFCDRIGVMYRGELMEEASAGDLYEKARHPYTRLLFQAISSDRSLPQEKKKEKQAVAGSRNAGRESEGCSFADRCPEAKERCFAEQPPFIETSDGAKVRCFER